MYIEKEDLKNVLYGYQVEDITQGDNSILDMAVSSAITEAKSYLLSRYNTDEIFNKKGKERNGFILNIIKDLIVWQLVRLPNNDVIYNKAEIRYEQAISFLKSINKGDMLLDIPLKSINNDDENIPSANNSKVVNVMKKFNNEYN